MTDFSADSDEAARLEPMAREAVQRAINGSAVVAEFTVGTMFEGRPALSAGEQELAIALNTLAELLSARAGAAAEAGDPRWEGLADAATMLRNELGRRRLPQLPSLETA